MPQLSKRVAVLQESAIRKLDQAVAAQRGVDFLKLNIGQPEVPTPGPMLDVIQNYPRETLRYGPASGTPEFREAAALWLSRWCPELRADDVVATVGGSEALLFAFTAICDPGDELLVFEPYYTNYNGFATVAGARCVPVRVALKDGFELPDDDALDRAVGPRCRAIVFSNPGNPTGAIWGRETLARLLRFAARRDLFVIADEVYRRIWFDEAPASALEFPEFADRVVVVDSFSKTWSACGLRLGLLASRNQELMEKVERLGQARLGPQPLAQKVGLAALALPESHYEETRLLYQARVGALADGVARIEGARTHRPSGAFYCMVDLPVDDAERFARFLVTDFRDQGQSVVVAPGGGFYADPRSGGTEVRLAAVLDEARIRRATEVLRLAVQAYPGHRPRSA
jgi:aspartate aminotransferase